MAVRLLVPSLVIFCAVVLLNPVPLNAQTTIYWKVDHLRDANGVEIAVATPAPTDYTAPTTPGTPGAGTITTTSLALSWSGSTDAVGVVGYVIYRGPVPVGAVTGTSFTDVGLVPYTTYHYKVVAFDAAHNYSSSSAVLDVATSAPASTPLNMAAAATSTTQVELDWTAPSSGSYDHYGIYRRSGGSWSKLGTTSSTNYSDTTVSADTAYVYKVSAENSSNTVLGTSNIDLATTVFFTDDPITVESTLVKELHITQLRTAVAAVRAAAGLGAATWTNASISGAWIKAVDISELRAALDDATNALGLPAANYTDSALSTSMTIRKAHIEELRARVK